MFVGLMKDEIIKKFCTDVDDKDEIVGVKEISNEKHEVEFYFPEDAKSSEEVKEAIIKTTYTVTERSKFVL